MDIKTASFITSVADMAKYPELDKPEITFVGRSNVGKSSLINLLCGQKSLARTSSEPGRTRLVNIFDINNSQFILVDLPGYGFQAGSKSDAKGWGMLIEKYLQYRMQLKHVFLLLDIRHEPSKQDRNMVQYLNYLRIPFSVIATKADKVSKAHIKEQISMLDSFVGVGIDNILPVSVLKKEGKKEVLDKLESVLTVQSVIE